MRYDSVLFDFDGVLVDSEPIHYRCWSEILAGFGLTLSWEAWSANCIGVSDRKMLQRMSAQLDPPLSVDVLYATYPRKKARFVDLMEREMPFFDGAVRLFEELQAGGLKLAVVTSSGRGEVEPILSKAGLTGFLGAAVYGGDVENLKPAPDPYLKAASILGAQRPLVIEDSDAGEQSGRAAGFDVLRVAESRQVPRLLRERILG